MLLASTIFATAKVFSNGRYLMRKRKIIWLIKYRRRERKKFRLCNSQFSILESSVASRACATIKSHFFFVITYFLDRVRKVEVF